MYQENDLSWFIRASENDIVYGPYSLEQVRQAVDVGKLHNQYQISQDQIEWKAVADILFTPPTFPQYGNNNTEELLKKPFGFYKLLQEVGRGGMGIVYKALDTRVDRVVAVKILLQTEWVQDSNELQRFQREAKLVAQLDHPNIVRMFDVGENPQLYFTMEYIEGHPLTQIIKQKMLSIEQLTKLFHKICSALEYAHKQKIIHRDIKPGNILIDASGNPKITDFGLAKGTREQSDLSTTGEFLGTPKYVSPEQAEGKEVDQRTDVYSLGAVFYELLTGRVPFEGDSVFNILAQLAGQEPIPLRRLNPDIPQDLELITLTCLEKKPKNRYLTPGGVRRDLEKYLNNRPISIKPPGAMEKAAKWVQRNRLVSAFIGVICISALALTFMLTLVSSQNTQLVELNSQMYSESYQNGLDAFYRQDFKESNVLFTEAIEDYQNKFKAYWIRGTIAFIERKHQQAAKDLKVALKNCQSRNQRCKILLLLTLCSGESKENKKALSYLEKAKKEFVFSEKGQNWQIYPTILENKHSKLAQLNFLPPISKSKDPKDSADIHQSISNSRYYTVLSLLPHNASQQAYRQIAFDKQSIEGDLAQEIYKLEWLLIKNKNQWFDNFLNKAGGKTTEDGYTYPLLAEIKEMLLFANGQWICSMATPYWAHLAFTQQRMYAKNYQQQYALHINQPVLQKFPKNNPIFNMALIPPGQFLMGENTEGDEGPQHIVTIEQAFFISTTEMTQQQWKLTAPSSINLVEIPKVLLKRRINKHPDAPITYINKNHVLLLLEHLGKNYNLPNERQWEYVCKAGYSNSWIKYHQDLIAQYVWYIENSVNKAKLAKELPKAKLVGQLKPNAWGIFDMHGNVAEYCNNVFFNYSSVNEMIDINWNNKLKTKLIIDNPAVVVNELANFHILRGGYIGQQANNCRAALRSTHKFIENPYIGIRLIKKIK